MVDGIAGFPSANGVPVLVRLIELDIELEMEQDGLVSIMNVPFRCSLTQRLTRGVSEPLLKAGGE